MNKSIIYKRKQNFNNIIIQIQAKYNPKQETQDIDNKIYQI